MFIKDEHKIKLINRDGLELSGYYNKTDSDKCVVAFCGFGGNCDKAFCAIAQECENNNISFLFGNTQGSYVKKSLKRHMPNGEIVLEEKGAFNEDFDKCVKDINEWLNFASAQGFKELYLVGASIACNRIVNYLNFYLYPKNIKKVILLCPQHLHPQIDANMIKEAELYMSTNMPDKILTDKFFGYCDVTAKTYYNIAHNPQLDNLPYLTNGDFTMLKNLKLPLRIIIGAKDEGIVLYSDKSAKYYMEILKQNYENLKYEIIENCRHNFKNNEQELAQLTIKYILE